MTETQAPSSTEAEPVRDVLLRRARRLAAPTSQETEGEEIQVLVCLVRGEQYAVDLRSLEGVRPFSGVTPVPCTPPFVAGVLNVRGDVITVLDLALALGLGGAPGAPEPGARVLLVDLPAGADGAPTQARRARHRIGLLVDGVLDVQPIATEALIPALSGNEYSRGVAGAQAVLLDVARLLSDGRFQTSEEVAE